MTGQGLMTGQATHELRTYLGPERAPLFGAVHLPVSGQVRGTILICPPLGKEHFDAVRGLRLLADELAGIGIAALRLDYYGTGDSAYESDRDDVVGLWRESVRIGLDALRNLAPLTPGVVALRAGALIVSDALASGSAGEIGPVVLWDPVARGRAYVREQRALFSMAVGASVEPGLAPLVGMTLTEAAAAELSRLNLDATAFSVASRRLVAARPERKDPAFAAAAEADELVVRGMLEFVQAPGVEVRIPGDAIKDIREWVDAVVPRGMSPASPTIRETASFENPDGTQVVERIEMVGEHGVFAIRASRAASSAEKSVLFFATANDPHHGPNRSWVSLSREVAAVGAQALRFDRRGAGESSPVRADERLLAYGPGSTDDALAAAAAVSSSEGVLVAGVCSGSWFAAAVARAGRATAVVLINAVQWSWRHKRAMSDPSVQNDPGDFELLRSDPEFQSSLRGRVKSLLQRRLPYAGWLLLGRLGVTQVPEVLLRPLLRAGVDLTVVLAPPDSDWFDIQRGPAGIRRLPALKMIRTEEGDHPACHPAVRGAVRAVILEWCTRTVAPALPAAVSKGPTSE